MSWSYSRYSMWKACPRKYKYRVIENLPETMHPAASRGTEIHAHMENYLLGNLGALPPEIDYYQSFLDGLKEIGVHPEIRLSFTKDWTPCEWDAPDRFFRCVLDALVLRPDRAVVYDWKTGKEYPDHINQREIYAVAVSAAHPELLEISVYHTYLDTKQNTWTTWHRDEIPALREKWEAAIEPMFADTMYEAKPSWMCRFCAFSSRYGTGPCIGN